MNLFYVILYIYLTSIGIAGMVSLLSFYFQYPKHLKLFSVLLFLTFFVEIVANVYLKKYHVNHLRSGLYTWFSLIEFIIYAYYYYILTDVSWFRKLLLGFMIFFPFLWVFTVFYGFGFTHWNSPQIAIGGFFTVVFSLLFLYLSSSSDTFIKLTRYSEFWIAIGLILFYSCEIPYLGLLNYLTVYHLEISKILLKVSMIIDTLMYCCFTYAYICRMPK